MRSSPWILCMWPGLPRLWLRGELVGLLVAMGFAALLSFALLSGCVWPELVHPVVVRLAWAAVSTTWLIAAAWTWRRLPQWTAAEAPSADADPQQRFRQAQDEYLQGNWHRAEGLLRRILRRNARDVEARLLLATLYRRTRQPDAARRQLTILGRLESAEPWKREIVGEWEQLRRDSVEAEAAEPVSAESQPPPSEQTRAA